MIQNLYSRAWTFSDDRIPQLSFSETGLRFSSLLMITARSGGDLRSTNVEQTVINASFETDSLLKQAISSPTKAELVAFLFRSFPGTETDASLTIADRTSLLASMTAILSDLGAYHERAYLLKELVASLVPALVEARKRGAAEMGVHPAASLASLDAALVSARRTNALSAFGEDEAGVQDFLNLVCRAYYIDIQVGIDNHYHTERDDEQTKSTEDSKHLRPAERVSQCIVQHAQSKISASSELKIDILRSCINVCEALPDLEGVLHFSVELLRASGSGIAPGPDDSNGASSLSIEDQLRLWNNISRTVGVARQLGLKNLEAEYWDDFLLRGIDVIPSASNRPVSHDRRELDLVDQGSADIKQGLFLYNPFGQSNQNKAEKPLLVAGEQAVFRVTLQNLDDFDLEIESIRLTADNNSCTTDSQPVIVGPYRTQSFCLTARPSEDGVLIINGCMAKIRGCRERWFPLFDAPWSFKANVKSLQTQHTRPLDANFLGDQENPDKKRLKAPAGPAASSLILDVIPTLPHLTLKSMTLSQAAVMLLQGETKRLWMTLHNASKTVKADLVLPTFEDSTATQLQAAMDNNELTPTDLHELQLASLKKPLRWSRTDDSPDVTIEPGEDYTLDIEITGKPGLSDATILVSYGHLGVPRNQIKDGFYTRQLSVTLTVTVNASIDITRTDILPFSSNFAWQNQKGPPFRSSPSTKSPTETRRPPSMSVRSKSNKLATHSENRFHSLLSRIGLSSNDDKSHCLVCLDCRNSWPTPLSVSIQVLAPPSSHDTTTITKPSPPSALTNDNNLSPPKITYTVHESLQPGHTKRILLLLPRLRLPHAHHPIPSLDPKRRQFVVSSAPKKSHESEMREREAYWYRKALLSMLQANWIEESTGRKGTVNLRNIRLNDRHIDVLKLQDIHVEMSLSLTPRSPKSTSDEGHDNDTAPNTPNTQSLHQLSSTLYSVPLSTHLTLTTTLTNTSPHPIHPLLRLQPRLSGPHPHNLALDLGRKFLVHGVLQKAMGVLRPGESGSHGVEVWVMGRGRWAVGGVVEEVRVVGGEEGAGGGGVGRNGEEEVTGGGGRGGGKRQGEEKRKRRVCGVEEGVEIVGCDAREE